MKRLSLKHAYLFFGILIGTMLMTFIGLCKKVRSEQAREQQVFDIMWAEKVDTNSVDIPWTDVAMDSVMTTAGVTVQDSVIFEYLASLATVIDLPEERPMDGDSVCAYVSHDTVFIEYYNVNKYPGFEYQKQMFKFLYNQ